MKLSLAARQLLTILIRRSRRTGYCWCRQETLASILGCDVRTIKRRVAELVSAGVLRSERHGHGNHYKPQGLAVNLSHEENIHKTVEKPVENELKSCGRVPSDGTNLSHREPPYLITEVLRVQERVVERMVVGATATKPNPEPASPETPDPAPQESGHQPDVSVSPETSAAGNDLARAGAETRQEARDRAGPVHRKPPRSAAWQSAFLGEVATAAEGKRMGGGP